MLEAARDRLRLFGLPWLPPLVGPLLLFGPALVAGRALFWGTPLLQFIPWRIYAKQLLAQGQLPLWNSALGMGAPLLANYQSALLYPPNWLLLGLDVAWGQTLLAMLHLMWAGVGMALLARRLGMRPFAQTVSALAFGLSAYLVTRAGFLSINAAAAWLPWIVLAADQLAVGGAGPPPANGGVSPGRSNGPNGAERLPPRPSVAAARPARPRIAWQPLGFLALALAMQWLAGHAQMSAYSLAMAVAWTGYRSARAGGWSGLASSTIQLSLAGLLALAVAAVQLLPTAEYLSVSDRSAGLDREFALTYSFWPWRLIGLVAPDMFGHPRDGSYWGYGNYWEDAIYIGLLPALLAGVAVLRRRGGGLRWFLAGVAGLSLALALGKNAPLFPVLFDNVPGFGLFQAPTRWNLLLVFALALLAGFGAQGWRRAEGRSVYWLRLGTAGAAAVVLTAAAARLLLTGNQLTFVPALMLAGGLAFGAGSLALLRGKLAAGHWRSLAVGLILFDLLYAARGANPTLPLDFFDRRDDPQLDAYAGERLYMPEAVEQVLKFDLAFRFDDYQAERDWSVVRRQLLPNTNLLDGLESANNFDPIRSARYVAWIDLLEQSDRETQRVLLQYMGVGWLADPSGRYQPLIDPRAAWMAARAVAVDGADSAWQALRAGALNLSETVLIEAGTDQGRAGMSGDGVAVLETRGAGRVELRVESQSGGWVVLADSWYPGWNAYLDGEPIESFPANGAFRAVWVPAGQHQLSYRYEPASIRIGAVASVLGLIAMAIVLLRGGHKGMVWSG